MIVKIKLSEIECDVCHHDFHDETYEQIGYCLLAEERTLICENCGSEFLLTVDLDIYMACEFNAKETPKNQLNLFQQSIDTPSVFIAQS